VVLVDSSVWIVAKNATAASENIGNINLLAKCVLRWSSSSGKPKEYRERTIQSHRISVLSFPIEGDEFLLRLAAPHGVRVCF
jgi:hypothetical protein